MTVIPPALLSFINNYERTNLPNPLVDPALRSWKQLHTSPAAILLSTILQSYPAYGSMLPEWDEWQEQLALAQRVLNLPYYHLHVSFSSPVRYPSLPGISSLLKLYNGEGVQQVRVKISSFVREDQSCWWEVGFVHAHKSLSIAEEDRVVHRDSYYLLSGLVANTYKFMLQRAPIQGIHLSPAYFHIWPLSKRIVHQYPHFVCEEIDAGWLQQVEQSYALHGVDTIFTSTQRRRVQSRLLEQGLLKNAKGEMLKWNPPEMIILR